MISDQDIRAAASANDSAPDLTAHSFNDHGNAERLNAMFGNDLRYCHPLKKWFVWDGQRWAPDETGKAVHFAKRTMIEFNSQVVLKHKGDAAEKFARASLNMRSITGMLAMAQSDLYVMPSQLDTHPELLNFQNGTVDLRSGTLRPHDRADFITKLIHYDYVPTATCPLWLRALDQMMGGGPDASEGNLESSQRMVEYLQRAFGYSLTGLTSEKAIFVLFGKGNNGKSTMLTTFRQLIAEYAVLIQADSLMSRQESNNTQADLADLRGARFVQTSETEEGQKLSQGKVKRITQGMGMIKAVRKYENPIEFPETHKLWLDTNRKPDIRDADDSATFNRLHPIPFTVTITDIDREMPAKLIGEAEGILAWAVQGAVMWYENGLEKPEEIDAARERWRSDSDQLGRFVAECCVVHKGCRVPASALYAEYSRWAEAGKEKDTLSGTFFGRKIGERYTKDEKNSGNYYLGIGLKTAVEE